MDSLAEEFSTLTVATAQAEPIRALGPIAEKQTLQETQFIFRGQDRQKLSTHGEVSTPNLPELFIAVMGDH
jgi:hypothetical protein